MLNVESLDRPLSVLGRKLKVKMMLTLQIIFVFFIMLLSKDLPMEWTTNKQTNKYNSWLWYNHICVGDLDSRDDFQSMESWLYSILQFPWKLIFERIHLP